MLPDRAQARRGRGVLRLRRCSGVPWQPAEIVRFTELLDEALARESAGYAGARTQRRLAAPVLRLLDRDAFQRDWHAAVATGIRPTQVKDRLFRQDDALWRRLTGGV